jgi:hypothetical protein
MWRIAGASMRLSARRSWKWSATAEIGESKGPLYYPSPTDYAAMSAIPALEIQDLKKTYANGVEALKGVSLAVQASRP